MASSTTKPTDSVNAIKRQIVQAESGERHAGEGAYHGDRQCHRGNDGRRQLAQEQEYHRHDKTGGNQQGLLHIVDGGADGLAAIVADGELYRRRQGGRELRQHLLDIIDHFDRV